MKGPGKHFAALMIAMMLGSACAISIDLSKVPEYVKSVQKAASDVQKAIAEGQIPTSVKTGIVQEAAQLAGPALYWVYTGCMWRCVNYAFKNLKSIACEKECARDPYKTW